MLRDKNPFPLAMQHIALEVSDMKISLRFYREVLGMKVTEQHSAFEVKAIPVGLCFLRFPQSRNHHDLVLTHDPNKDYTFKAKSTAPNFHHMAFQLTDEAHWLRCLEHIRKLNIEVVRGPLLHSPFQEGGDGSWGENKSFYILDPDGHRLEFFCDMARIDGKGFYRDEKGSLIHQEARVSEY